MKRITRSGAGDSAVVSEPRLGVRRWRALPISACLASRQRWERSQENTRSDVGQVATGELSRVLDSSSSHVRAPWEGTARPHLTRVPASGQDVPSWADPISAEGGLSL